MHDDICVYLGYVCYVLVKSPDKLNKYFWIENHYSESQNVNVHANEQSYFLFYPQMILKTFCTNVENLTNRIIHNTTNLCLQYMFPVADLLSIDMTDLTTGLISRTSIISGKLLYIHYTNDNK